MSAMAQTRDWHTVRARIDVSLTARVARVRPALWPLAQTAVGAAASWWLAQVVLGHDEPIFAPITAIVAMGFAAGRRGRQVIAIVVGTALGIGIADLLLSVLDAGAVQVGVVVFLAMVVGLLLSPQPLFVTQVAISAMLLVAVERQTGVTLDRLGDAVLGGLVALALAVVLFPADPLRLVDEAGARVFEQLAATLGESAQALRDGDVERARRARERAVDDLELSDAVELALDVTRIAPLRRRDAPRVERVAAGNAEVPALARGVRVAAGTALRLLRADASPSPELAEPLDELARALRLSWRWLHTGDDVARADARRHAEGAARLAARYPDVSRLAEGALLHLVQAMARRILMTTGVEPGDASSRALEPMAED
jgi:hypothetical protein